MPKAWPQRRAALSSTIAAQSEFFSAKLNTCDSPLPKSQAATTGAIVLTSTVCIQEILGNCVDATSSFVVTYSKTPNGTKISVNNWGINFAC
ncbi:hypothetical protein [Nostoc sp.]|uniref:hypothetical protein n=1 Tax=Nostoc sp. TaxID=1180 RepID=UPI002FFD5164